MEKETLEEVAERLLNLNELDSFRDYHYKQELQNAFKFGTKWQQEQDNTANEILEYILLNDDGVGIALGYNSREMREQYFKRINYGKSK
jgi:hypothetical protein